LAKELSAEEYFEHEIIRSSTFINNAYLFFFGSSLDDLATVDALANAPPTSAAPVPEDHRAVADALTTENGTGQTLWRATQRILALDAIGLTKKFQESVETIFASLGFPAPQQLGPAMVTDELPNLETGFSRVPPVAMTTRLSRALQRLTRYDKLIYEIAEREFERRRSVAVPNSVDQGALRSGGGE
jgi:hypothetical protein